MFAHVCMHVVARGECFVSSSIAFHPIIFIFYLFILVVLGVCVWVYMFHGTDVEVRGQFVGVSILLPPCGYQGSSQFIGLGDGLLYLQSHHINPTP